MFKKIALPVCAIIIFTAGVMWGVRIASPDESITSNQSSLTRKPHTKSAHIHIPDQRRAGLTERSTAQHPIVRDLQQAMRLPHEARIKPLLMALEETSKIPLSKDLAEAMRAVIDKGEIESSQYLMSLLEQREEKAAIDLLLDAAEHQDRDVADRALFALEAVAGTVFKTKEEAATWAASWEPDPDRVKLFSPNPQNDQATSDQNATRMPGPGSQARKTPTGNAPESEN